MADKGVEAWNLRLRFFLFFALIGLGAAAVIAVATTYAIYRLGPLSLDVLVLAGGASSFAIAGLVLWVWIRFDDHVARPLLTVARETHAVVHGRLPDALTPAALRYLGPLAPAIREAMTTIAARQAETDAAVAAATAEADRQRRRLEAVLRDLGQGVVICSLDHEILLYNRAAHALLDPDAATGAHLGLGRPLTRLIAAQPLRHSLTRLTAGPRESDHDGAIAFVASSLGARDLLRCRMALIYDADDQHPISYVLSFDRITDELVAGLRRDRLLHELTADLRCQTAALTLAGETLLRASSDAERDRVRRVFTETRERLGIRLDGLDGIADNLLAGAWPMAPVSTTVLCECIVERCSEGRRLHLTTAGPGVVVLCDSVSVVELAERLLNRIAVWDGVCAFDCRASFSGETVYLDFSWPGQVVPQSVLGGWLDEPLEECHGEMTGRDVLHRHKTDLWCDTAANGHVRLRLPLQSAAKREAVPRTAIPERPEFYDFDLAAARRPALLEDTPLRTLSLVVFDTETTGLEPSRGDEIVQIAGVRVVNGRVLTGEAFETLVDPGRPIPPASSRIHGISDAMVLGAGRPDQAVAQFHDFVGGDVLAAHNAAFDMAFLTRHRGTGAVFDQPVLDTVLLAAHVYGPAESLTLDALSARFGIPLAPEERHSALGDARATAAVLLRLVDLLEPLGVVTLGQALAIQDMQGTIRRKQARY